VTGWRLALRIARREALRAKARSLLALVMITLPVLGVVAADVLYRTQDVNTAEGLNRSLGIHGAALVRAPDPAFRLEQQRPDPDAGYLVGGKRLAHPATMADVADILGHRTMLPVADGQTVVDTDHGKTPAQASELDLADPLAAGLFRLDAGHWPRTTGEAVVNAYLAGRGPALGDAVVVTHTDGTTATLRVVGIAESVTYRSTPVVAGLPGSLGLDTGEQSWLVSGGPVGWSQVRALNRRGATVLSRAVVEHPPAVAQTDPASDRGQTLTIVGLVVAMVLIEVVLLAGPSFAVGARRQQRALALLAAAGGTPRQARRVVLASGVVLGAVAAGVGVAGGIGLARLLQPVLQRHSDVWFGPFQVAPLDLLGVAAFGMASALLAAVVPAWVASRQDVVAVLAGRRGDARPSRRSPLIGLVLLGLGVALAAVGARGYGTQSIALAAIVCVLGMVLLVPMVVAVVARLGRHLPLPLRFAVRDAARHRTRTVPAVAAVAATVAGVVALGISTSSDQRESRELYQPVVAMGDATVSPYVAYEGASPTDWASVRARVAQAGLHVVAVRGQAPDSDPDSYLSVRAPGAGGEQLAPDTYHDAFGSDVLVSAGDLPAILDGVPGLDRAAAHAVLADGGAVVFAQTAGPARVVLTRERSDDQGEEVAPRQATVPALVMDTGEMTVPARAVLSPAAARAVGIRVGEIGLYLPHPRLSVDEQRDLDESLQAVGATVYVERGYQPDPATRLVRIILFLLAAVLMLGGTLTATFLALADARPDLATLSAIGAAPRTRRAIAAAYALAVGLVGAVLGAAVGFVPGIAISYPLTRTACGVDACQGAKTFIDVPWLTIIGLVIALPLVVAAVVGLVARSRLPLTARLE
jgi:putative ABC transport system permease protein